VRTKTDLTVVCGDLNLFPDSETFAVLGTIGLVDLVGATDTSVVALHQADSPRQLPHGVGSRHRVEV
jgi:endonuclease/exonuclease/phosphatase family metal-dependent hydrolase